MREPLRIPNGLHEDTAQLVIDFASAMAEKLFAAQEKYGYSDEWKASDWMDECRSHLREHMGKGDPRDVANYCAFLWYHKQSTAAAPAAAESLGAADGLEPIMDAIGNYMSNEDLLLCWADVEPLIRARELVLRQRVEGERALREVFEKDKYVEMAKAIDAENKMLALQQRLDIFASQLDRISPEMAFGLRSILAKHSDEWARRAK